MNMIMITIMVARLTESKEAQNMLYSTRLIITLVAHKLSIFHKEDQLRGHMITTQTILEILLPVQTREAKTLRATTMDTMEENALIDILKITQIFLKTIAIQTPRSEKQHKESTIEAILAVFHNFSKQF